MDAKKFPEFDSIKDDNETILWLGKPKFFPYLFADLGQGLLTLAFGILWIFFAFTFNAEDSQSPGSFFWLFGLLPVAVGLVKFLNRVLSYPNTAYAYSNRRVMMRTGFVGTDFKIIDYDKISDIEVTVNVVEKMCGVGTIRFFSGRTKTEDDSTTKLYDMWASIENPYAVFKMVKQTSVDIKTDYNYPNALRPETNPGYHTTYNRT